MSDASRSGLRATVFVPSGEALELDVGRVVVLRGTVEVWRNHIALRVFRDGLTCDDASDASRMLAERWSCERWTPTPLVPRWRFIAWGALADQPGGARVDIVGVVLTLEPARVFPRPDGTQGVLRKIELCNETCESCVRVTLFLDEAALDTGTELRDLLTHNLTPGVVVALRAAKVELWQGAVALSANASALVLEVDAVAGAIDAPKLTLLRETAAAIAAERPSEGEVAPAAIADDTQLSQPRPPPPPPAPQPPPQPSPAPPTDTVSTLTPPRTRSVVLCEGERERVVGCATAGEALAQLCDKGIGGDFLRAGRMGERLDDAQRLEEVEAELWLGVRGRGGALCMPLSPSSGPDTAIARREVGRGTWRGWRRGVATAAASVLATIAVRPGHRRGTDEHVDSGNCDSVDTAADTDAASDTGERAALVACHAGRREAAMDDTEEGAGAPADVGGGGVACGEVMHVALLGPIVGPHRP